ncbi:MAG: hypothetical protein PHV63_04030 [Candidatus Daviesbacteria bacterium]|nr:hypothetical protein [Candidatus Daviesbacteria bacterium]
MDSPNPLPAPVPTPEVTPQVYVQPASPLKKLLKISLILSGIIILILTIILTLNYFNILSLSSLFPKYFSFLPHQDLFFKNPLIGKAKSLGYTITYIDPKDTTGRTVFYEGKGIFGNNGIGEQITKNPDGSSYTSRIIGIFQELKDTPASPDKYLILVDLKTRKSYQPLRIILDPEKASTLSAKPTLPLTQLFVENLNILVNISTQNGELINEFYKLSNDEIKNILRNGDAVNMTLWPTYTSDKKALTNSKDESGKNIIWKLYIRRFGGKAQIEKELGRSI